MAKHAELRGTEERDLCLPPSDLALPSAACALVNMNTMKQLTIGGGIFIMTTWLLATFPNLYTIPNKPFEKLVHVDRGNKNTQGSIVKWCSNDVEVESDAINIIVKAALALAYCIMRKPQQNPTSQITRRFSTLYSTLFPSMQAPFVDLDLAFDFHETAAWLGSKG